MNNFKVGFGRVDITPPMTIGIDGYYIPRSADGVLDTLDATAVALEYGKTRALLISLDVVGIKDEFALAIRKNIEELTGVSQDAIFISATHTHTGPVMGGEDGDIADFNDLEKKYNGMLFHKTTDAAILALNDLKSAKMGYGIGQAPNVAFVRRFRMKDGSVKTNPGVNNPDIVAPIGDVDERVSVVRFDRENAETVVLVNFANHPDVVGGNKISGDWPALLCDTVEKTIDNTKCIFFNGAEGDVNHVNVHPKPGDFNGMFNDFDDVSRGYSHALYIARVVTGGVLQCYDKVNYVEVDSLKYLQKMISVESNMPTPEEIPEAIRINELHEAGRDAELPYEGMMLTTVVAEAQRMVKLKDGPASFEMRMGGIAVGPVAFIGLPGEAFTDIGRAIKDTEGYDLIIPCGLTNGYKGYFPMKDAYDEGGYEARSSPFKAGIAEKVIEEGKKLIKEMEEK